MRASVGGVAGLVVMTSHGLLNLVHDVGHGDVFVDVVFPSFVEWVLE